MNDLFLYFGSHRELTVAYAVFIVVFVVSVATLSIVVGLLRKRASSISVAVETALSEYESGLYSYGLFADEDGRFAALCESDTIILRTPSYSSLAGVKSAMKSLITNVSNDNFSISATNDRFTVKLYSSTRPLFESEEFDSLKEAEEFVTKIKRASSIAKSKIAE